MNFVDLWYEMEKPKREIQKTMDYYINKAKYDKLLEEFK